MIQSGEIPTNVKISVQWPGAGYSYYRVGIDGPNKPDIVDTRFKKSSSPSFPFLLLEARPEHGCPDFTSIEEQSAFPLRTLLNIQNNVPTTPEARFEPLVWFMANQGDEWRTYACIPDGFRTVGSRI
jgi:hypothetical protein